MKKVIFLILFTTILFSSESKYLKVKDYSNNDSRIFVGILANYGYLNSKQTSDKSIYSYGLYIGIPVFYNYEIILNKYNSVTSDFTLNQQSLIFNIPLSSRETRRVYIGVVGGLGELDMKDNTTSIEKITDKFYGFHIGKRYKFTRNYYARIELEALRYDYKGIEEKDTSFTFNYGFEYRF